MSTTWTAFTTSRFDTQRLIELTNPGDTSATSVNSTRGENAVTDAKAQFARHVGRTSDETDAEDLAVLFLGVHYFLLKYRGLPPDEEERAVKRDWIDELKVYARTEGGSKAWVEPQTTSQLTPTDESPNGEIVRPAFDIAGPLSDMIPDKD